MLFKTFPSEGWNRTDTLKWRLPASNTNGNKAGVSLLLRTEQYPYSNIAVEVIVYVDTTNLLHERKQFVLSESSSQPTHIVGNRFDYTLPIGNTDTRDTFNICVLHLMADTLLKGTHQVGIKAGQPLCDEEEVVWKVRW